MNRPVTTLFMLMSVDGKISTGAVDNRFMGMEKEQMNPYTNENSLTDEKIREPAEVDHAFRWICIESVQSQMFLEMQSWAIMQVWEREHTE